MNTKVYFNLHKRCLSIQKKVDSKWRVDKYSGIVYLENVKFKVSEAGRQRVLREKRKNVHAKVVGDEIGGFKTTEDFRRVFYNPYEHETFHDEDGNPVMEAKRVIITGSMDGYVIFAEI